jgi:signal transduction histidine kinase
VFGYYFRVNQLTREKQKLESVVGERTYKIQLQKEKIEAQNQELLSQASYLAEKNAELEKAKGLLEIEVKYVKQNQLFQSSIQIQEEERKRIAQDLHDELGAVLSIARMHLVQIQNQKVIDSSFHTRLQQARMLTETALATMRRISHDLMPPQLENFGLIKTLETITAQMQITKGIQIEFNSSDDQVRFALPIELGLYRICMEMINNTLKHAEAKAIKISLQIFSSHILFSYTDDGKGLPKVIHAGHGFKNIETRVNILGGEFTTNQREQKGFSATIKLFKTV